MLAECIWVSFNFWLLFCMWEGAGLYFVLQCLPGSICACLISATGSLLGHHPIPLLICQIGIPHPCLLQELWLVLTIHWVRCYDTLLQNDWACGSCCIFFPNAGQINLLCVKIIIIGIHNSNTLMWYDLGFCRSSVIWHWSFSDVMAHTVVQHSPWIAFASVTQNQLL